MGIIVSGYSVTPVDAADVREMIADVRRLYQRCFADPPWNETDFSGLDDRLATHFDEPGLCGVAARDAAGLAGLGYGWPTPAARWRSPVHDAVTALPEGSRASVAPPAFEVIELMVDPVHQGRGLGRTLLDDLVRDRTRAWLSTHLDAPARRLYDAAGWTLVGRIAANGMPLVVYAWDSGGRAGR